MADIEVAAGAADHHVVGFVLGDLAIKQVHIAHKVGHKAAVGALINLIRRAHLQQTALAHDGDAVGHGHGLVLVVGHQHTGHAHLFDDVDQFHLGLFAQFFV